MKKFPLTTIVNFCTNESRYIQACLEQAQIFSKQVIVPVCDHFFDGSKENLKLVEEIASSFPQCLFVLYPFILEKIPKSIFKTVNPAPFWHSLSRLVGTKLVDEDVETILFLDADEIVEGEKFHEWLQSSNYHQHTAIKLANYWYFRLPIYQADQWEDSSLLVQRKALTQEMLLSSKERDAIYDAMPNPKKRMAAGSDGAPMIHHYSWVRTEEEMLKKVNSWSHKHDRDWTSLVKEEFSRPFQGKDFVHGYQFKTVSVPFKLSLGDVEFTPKDVPNIYKMNDKDLLKLLQSVICSPLKQFLSSFFG